MQQKLEAMWASKLGLASYNANLVCPTTAALGDIADSSLKDRSTTGPPGRQPLPRS